MFSLQHTFCWFSERWHSWRSGLPSAAAVRKIQGDRRRGGSNTLAGGREKLGSHSAFWGPDRLKIVSFQPKKVIKPAPIGRPLCVHTSDMGLHFRLYTLCSIVVCGRQFGMKSYQKHHISYLILCTAIQLSAGSEIIPG